MAEILDRVYCDHRVNFRRRRHCATLSELLLVLTLDPWWGVDATRGRPSVKETGFEDRRWWRESGK